MLPKWLLCSWWEVKTMHSVPSKKTKSRKAAKPQPAPSLLEEVSTQVNEPKAEVETEKTA